jgi:D-alanyl-D-alanine carboxypeptidase (penicillin-binding protein 5/6)
MPRRPRVRALAAVALALVAAGPALAQAAADPFAGRARAYLVQVDGVPLWSSASDAELAPASLTKLMTALVIADAIAPADVVTVSPRAARASGARLGLGAGTRITAGELMTAMLLRSANDACLALAEHAAGSEARLVAAMNRRARSMRLAATRFRNACGFDEAGHHSSAADLARLAAAFTADARLAAIVAREGALVRTQDGRTFSVANTNALVGRVRGAIGIKTGYTARAGHCLVALVERDGVRVLVVLLGARDRWWDAVAMVEQAFEAAKVRPATATPAR